MLVGSFIKYQLFMSWLNSKTNENTRVEWINVDGNVRGKYQSLKLPTSG